MALHGLKSLKLTKKETKGSDSPVDSNRERFPFGTTLHLDDDTLKKLELDLPNVGEEMIVVGIGVVTSVSARDGQSGKNRDVDIQLQRMEVGPLKARTAKQRRTALDAISEAISEADKDA